MTMLISMKYKFFNLKILKMFMEIFPKESEMRLLWIFQILTQLPWKQHLLVSQPTWPFLLPFLLLASFLTSSS